MLHEPAAPAGKDFAEHYKMRLGVWMFILYTIFYTGFVFINLYDPLLMESTVLFGLNLASVYGFGLIVVAMLQALLYDVLCRSRERALNTTPPQTPPAAPEGVSK